MNKKNSPPKLASLLFKSFLRWEDSEHRLGDLNESFHFKLKHSNYTSAAAWFWLQVLKSIPSLILNELYWGGTMITNYFKIAFRNLIKTKLYSILNIVGLGTAIALGVVGYVNYKYSQSYDTFHKNKESIYSIYFSNIVNHQEKYWSYSPMPLRQEIKNNIPGVVGVTRLTTGGGTVKYGDNVFNENFRFVDEDFFRIFTFPFIEGSQNALSDKSNIIITKQISEKYFGKEDPIGKQLILSPNGEKQFIFNVAAVVEKPPKNSSITFDIILPFEQIKEFRNIDPELWTDWTRATIVQLDKNVSPSKIEQQLQNYKQLSNEVNPDFLIENYHLMPLKELALSARDMNGDPYVNGMHPAAIIAPSVMAFLVLILSCFNFINTAIAFAARRLKEIGIRKVMGGLRSQLIKQFLTENIILCFMALLIGILLSTIFVPYYDSLWPEISLSVSFTDDPGLILFLVLLLIFTAIVAGSYPAVYISKFDPVNIFKGKQKFGGTSPLIRILLVLQFALSMTALIGGIILYENGKYINNLDLGFNKDQILILPVRGEDDYKLIKSNMKSEANIIGIAGSDHLVGRRWIEEDIEVGQEKSRMAIFNVGEDYFETMDFKLKQGRSFDSNLKTDIDNSVIVNETFVNQFGLKDPVGKFIKILKAAGDKELRIIGVAKDFHYNGVWREIEPAAITLAHPENYNYASIKFNLDQITEVSDFVQSKWKEIFPNLPYNGFYSSTILEEASMVTESIRKVFFYIALIVLITTGLGLFALVSLNIAKRSKEISIRKVLGASIANISGLISKEFIIMMLISSVLAAVSGYYMVDMLLSSIWAYYVDFGSAPFIISIVIMILLTLVSVSSQIIKLSNSNPIDNIRDE